MSWKRELAEFSESLLKAGLRATRVIPRGPEESAPRIVGYRGYGSGSRALLLGRAIRGKPLPAADLAHTRWRNLVHTFQRVDADPIPFPRITTSLGGLVQEHRGDDEGFLHAWVTTPDELPATGWHEARLALDVAGEAVSATAPVLVPPVTAKFGVISDMDDTVIQSQVTNFLRAVRTLVLENARTRLPFPGVAAFYRALQAGGDGGGANPIFYVSSSPWNLYDVIAEFMDVQEVPHGPLLLRDWDVNRSLLRNAEHKRRHLQEILDMYPSLPFLLIGDSGQEDPEIYTSLMRDNPGRVLAVYIRNVTPGTERSAAIEKLAGEVRETGATLVLADDTLATAKHAVEHGWIAEGWLDEIRGEKRADEGSGAKADAPGAAQGGEAPTVVVDESLNRDDVG